MENFGERQEDKNILNAIAINTSYNILVIKAIKI